MGATSVIIPNETKDSGVRQNFDTGAMRDSRENKGRYDLLSPLALRRLALVSERGAAKYSDRNWERGMPLSRFLDSSIRHTMQYLEGNRDEDHLGQACWNLTAALHTEEAISRGVLPAELYDVPNYQASAVPESPKDIRIRELEESNERLARQVEKLDEEIAGCPGACQDPGPGAAPATCENCGETEDVGECSSCRGSWCDSCTANLRCDCWQEPEIGEEEE